MTISKQYIADEQTYVVSISKPHINTIQNDYIRQYRNKIVPILACLLGTGNYSDSQEFFRIDSLSSTSSKPKLTEQMIVKDDDGDQFSIAFTLDTGAEVNVLPKRFFDQMSLSLHSTNITLTGFGRSIVRPCGQTVMKCIDKANECHELTFYVSDVIRRSTKLASDWSIEFFPSYQVVTA